MAQVSIKSMIEAGAHYGHRKRRWNPRMAPYIFGERNGIYIINLDKTQECLSNTLSFVRSVIERGKDILFIGTKKQAQSIVQEAALKCDMPFVTQRWLGGMLTNFETIRKSINRLRQIEKMEEQGDYKFITKKEVASIMKEKEKLKSNLSGIENMRKLPAAIFVVDTEREHIAIREAKKLGIPIIGLIDTNCDPSDVDYPLPANDDAARSISLFCSALSDVISLSAEAYQRAIEEEAEGDDEQLKQSVVTEGDVTAEDDAVEAPTEEKTEE